MKVISLALAFAVIFECVLPLVAPRLWQRCLGDLQRFDPARVRVVAALAVIVSLLFIWSVGA